MRNKRRLFPKARIRGQVEVLPTGDHTSTLIWLHGLGDNCENWKSVLLVLQSTNMKTICVQAQIIPITVERPGHPAGKIEIQC